MTRSGRSSTRRRRTSQRRRPRPEGAGTAWTWTALDADSKLIVSYLLSDARDEDSAIVLMRDLADRLEQAPVVCTDALPAYADVVPTVWRAPRHTMSKARTSYLERHNLTIRMGNRWFTRRTNGFSKRFECHATHLHLQLFHYNFLRGHISLSGATPAMAAGIARSFLSWRDLLETIK